MFYKIYRNKELVSIISSYCSENNIEICLEKRLEKNVDDKLLILQIDNYYSSKNIHNPPKAIDCLILLKCIDNTYNIYLIELKNIKSSNGFKVDDIMQKFETTIYDFLGNKFKDIFSKATYKDFKCYFVSDPYNCKGMSQEKYDEKIKAKGLKLEKFLTMKPFKFMNKIAIIEPILSNPLIREC